MNILYITQEEECWQNIKITWKENLKCGMYCIWHQKVKMYYHTIYLTYLVTSDSDTNTVLQRLGYRKQLTGVADAIAGAAP
jgi:hypothetical protein